MKLRQKLKLEAGLLEWPMKRSLTGVVVVKRLGSERPAEIALFAKEGRLLNNLHHKNIVEFQGCYFSTCALMLSYQCFDFLPFGIKKKANDLL